MPSKQQQASKKRPAPKSGKAVAVRVQGQAQANIFLRNIEKFGGENFYPVNLLAEANIVVLGENYASPVDAAFKLQIGATCRSSLTLAEAHEALTVIRTKFAVVLPTWLTALRLGGELEVSEHLHPALALSAVTAEPALAGQESSAAASALLANASKEIAAAEVRARHVEAESKAPIEIANDLIIGFNWEAPNVAYQAPPVAIIASNTCLVDMLHSFGTAALVKSWESSGHANKQWIGFSKAAKTVATHDEAVEYGPAAEAMSTLVGARSWQFIQEFLLTKRAMWYVRASGTWVDYDKR